MIKEYLKVTISLFQLTQYWIHVNTLTITEQGQLFSSDSKDNHYLLLQSLQSCFIQIYPDSNISGSGKSSISQPPPTTSTRRNLLRKVVI